MALWQKVLTSGSSAHVNEITASGIISASDEIYTKKALKVIGTKTPSLLSVPYMTTTDTMNNDGRLKYDYTGTGYKGNRAFIVEGNISSSGTIGTLEKLTDVNTTGSNAPSLNQVLRWNGTQFVPSTEGATFSFSIASFDVYGQPTTTAAHKLQTTSSLIGVSSGVWKAAGDLQFYATYNNGPPSSQTITMGGASNAWGSALTLAETSDNVGGHTGNTSEVRFPSNNGGRITFTLTCNGSITSTYNSGYFYNHFVYGGLTSNSSLDSDDITELKNENSIIDNDITRTLSGVSLGGSDYFAVAHRTGDGKLEQVRCGTGANTLTVGMDPGNASNRITSASVSYTNANSKVENFYIYASNTTNLDSHSSTFTTLTSETPKNYIYYGLEDSNGGVAAGLSSAPSYNEALVESSSHSKSSTYDQTTITGQELAIGTVPNRFVLIAIPTRHGLNNTDYQFKDNSGIAFGFTSPQTLLITNVCGFAETYYVYRSVQKLTYTTAQTITIGTV